MKLLLPTTLAALSILTSCVAKDKLDKAEEQNDVLNSQLQTTLATQDSLFVLINDISDGMAQIKNLESIVSTPGNLSGDGISTKSQVRNDMIAIQQALQQRRERLDQLEERLKTVSGKNTALLKTIENLKSQIAEQETEIATLNNQLAAANVKIVSLGAAVDSLNSSVEAEKVVREEAQQQAQQLTDELNTCYYAIGTKGELQKNQIIKTGFLRKTKILEGDFEKDYFTTSDKRSLNEIALHSKKAKVITNQPKDSYEIVDNGGQKVLKITNPTKFWSLSNFLVIQVD